MYIIYIRRPLYRREKPKTLRAQRVEGQGGHFHVRSCQIAPDRARSRLNRYIITTGASCLICVFSRSSSLKPWFKHRAQGRTAHLRLSSSRSIFLSEEPRDFLGCSVPEQSSTTFTRFREKLLGNQQIKLRAPRGLTYVHKAPRLLRNSVKSYEEICKLSSELPEDGPLFGPSAKLHDFYATLSDALGKSAN